MTTSIQQPSVPLYLEKIILEPYLEGAERINRAIKGVNLHHIQHPKINFFTRLGVFLVGVALMTPLINCVIWVFMKTIGNPETLHEPDAPPPPPIIINPLPPAVNEQQPLLDTRTLSYKDMINGRPLNAQWTIKTYEDVHHVTREDEESLFIISFDRDWAQKVFYYKYKEIAKGEVIVQRQDDVLAVNGIYRGKPVHKTFTLAHDYPWIQDCATGFRPFVLSQEKKMTFYGLDATRKPANPELLECTASKEEEMLDNYGATIKLTIKCSTGLRKILGTIAKCWFNPKTGDLIQMTYCVKIPYVKTLSEGESRLVREPG